jgi:hypothetical protein
MICRINSHKYVKIFQFGIFSTNKQRYFSNVKKILFFGTDQFAVDVLNRLYSQGNSKKEKETLMDVSSIISSLRCDS